jgi:TonB family protein
VRLSIALAIAILVASTAISRAQDVRQPPPQPPAKPTNVVTKPPKLIQAVAAEYPPAALAAGKQAVVKIRVHIDATGIVSAVDVLAPVGDGFDEAAVAAAKQYVFEPAEIDGVPAPIAVETSINFTIEQKAIEDEPVPTTSASPPSRTGPASHAGPMDRPVALQGTVLERGTRKKLAGVIISIAELRLDAVTDEQGRFFFHGLAPGKYSLLAVDARFDRLQRPIELAKREAVEVRLWMRPKGGNPYETVVEGEKETLEVTKRTVARQEMTSVPGTFGDPIRVITTLPGIQRAPFGLGLLLVRGSNPQDTGIYVDGHEVPSLFHFLGGPSIFNAEMLDSLTLYPGGFPARFGRHHGGAVALELRPTENDGFHGSAKIDFIDSGIYMRAPITKDLTVAVAGRRSYIDLFLGFILPKPASGAQRIVTPVYDDYSIRLDYNMHADGRLSLYVIGSNDSLHVLNKDPKAMLSQDLNSSISFFRVIASYVRPLGNGLKLTISPAWGRDTISYSGAEASAMGPFTGIDVINDALSYRMRIDGRINDRIVLDTGLDMLSRVTTYHTLIPDVNNLINSDGVDVTPSNIFRGEQTLGVGYYADVGIDVTKRLRAVASARVDGYVLDGEYRSNFDPRLVVKYKLDREWTLKGYAGLFTQPPQPESMDKRFGNPNIGLEHGKHFGLGYEFRPSFDKLLSLDSEIYYEVRDDVVVYSNDVVQNPDGSFQYINFANNGHRYSYGLELLLKRQISPHFFGWLSYTFSRSRVRETGDTTWSPTAFDQPNVLNAVASWKPGRGFELGVRYQYAAGRVTTPVVGATYNADTGSYSPVNGGHDSQRLPDFSQLDVRVEKDWLYNKWALGLYLDVINVFNTKNVEAWQYDYRYRERAPVTSLPFLPTLGVKGTW